MLVTDHSYLCRSVCKSHRNIISVHAIRNGKQLAKCDKECVAPPSKEELTELYDQAHMLTDIPQRNKRRYGKVELVIIRHAALDGLLFPLDSLEGQKELLAVACLRPYEDRRVIDSIKRIILDAS